MNILVVSSWVGFASSVRDVASVELTAQLQRHGHRAASVRIPAGSDSPEAVVDSMLAASLCVLERADLVIGCDFPSYLVPHGNKVLWIERLAELPGAHAHSEAEIDKLQEAVRRANVRCFAACRSVSVQAVSIGRRLLDECDVAATVLTRPSTPDDTIAWDHVVGMLTS